MSAFKSGLFREFDLEVAQLEARCLVLEEEVEQLRREKAELLSQLLESAELASKRTLQAALAGAFDPKTERG